MTLEEALLVHQAELAVYERAEDLKLAERAEIDATLANLRDQLAVIQSQIAAKEAAIPAIDGEIEDLNQLTRDALTAIEGLEARIATLSTMSIPPGSGIRIAKGDEGLRVWCLQRTVNSLGYNVLEDALFGDQTDWVVREIQRKHNLVVDGVFGWKTSGVVVAKLSANLPVLLPANLLRGLVAHETGSWIVAVNWSVAGGVDCGVVQRRVFEADYQNQDVIRRAFDTSYQLGLTAKTLRGRKDAYYGRAGATTHEKAWRLALLYHNYPSAASLMADTPISQLSSYWTTAQSWVTVHNFKFPDGASVRTPLEWCQKYSLGNASHDEPGQTAKLVTTWSA